MSLLEEASGQADRGMYSGQLHIFKALGVRKSPSIEDWALCTQEVYGQVRSQEKKGAHESKENTVLDRDVKVIQAALQCVIKLLKWQHGGRIFKGQNLQRILRFHPFR